MRVLIATEHGRVVGGIETYLRALAPLLRTAGHDLGFLFATPGDGSGPSVAGDHAGPVWTVGPGGEVPDEVARWRPEVVYAHGLSDPAAEDTLVTRFPTVYYAHAYFGTCVSLTKLHQFPVLQPCSRRLGQGCLAFYYPRRCGGLNPLTTLRLYRRERARQQVFPAYRAVLTASRHMAAEVIRNGAPVGRVKLAPLFPPESTPDPAPPNSKPQTNRILFVGRITAVKGWRQLVDAIPRAAEQLGRPLILVVAGDGPDRAAFEAEARRRSIPAEFLGWVSPDKRDSEMRSADVLAVPSVWPEPFGLVGIEAGCVGLPAVGFAVGGILDWLTPGISGELAPGQRPHPSKLADAFVRALGDDSHWQRMRIASWKVARRFTLEAHLDRLIPVLEAASRGAP